MRPPKNTFRRTVEELRRRQRTVAGHLSIDPVPSTSQRVRATYCVARPEQWLVKRLKWVARGRHRPRTPAHTSNRFKSKEENLCII